MNTLISSISKTTLCLSLLAFSFSNSFAAAACCSGHGGVAKCNTTTGYKMCKDGTQSPSCTCEKKPKKEKKAAKKKMMESETMTPAARKKAAQQPTTAPATQKTAPGRFWPFGTTKTNNTMKATGCCSSHGGISQCNMRTGFQMCKDGTQSPSCRCR